MIDYEELNNLNQRANELLKLKNKSTRVEHDVFQLIEKLNFYKNELASQNEKLLKSQEESQYNQTKYIDLFREAPVAYFTLDSEETICDVNDAGLSLLGLKQHLIISRPFSRYIVPEYHTLFKQIRKEAIKDEVVKVCELKLLRWSGAPFDAQLECKALKQSNTGNIQFLICLSDITQRKTKEKNIHLQQVKIAAIDKVRSINEQIYSIAHKQNHSLSVIDNYLYGCILRLETGKFDTNDLLQIIKKTAQQSRSLANIIQQMKSFTSKSTFRYESANIHDIINEVLGLIHYESEEFSVKTQYEAMNEFPNVKLDKIHIQQALLNLVRNALEAMRDANTPNAQLLVAVRLIKDSIEITILDNGPGFSAENAHKLFEPHFTTKSYAIGLGLTVSRTIIEKHGGQIQSQVNPTGGACFQITLPCVIISN